MYKTFFKPYPVIKTKRTVLKMPEYKSAEDMFKLCKNENVARYSDWTAHKNIYESAALIRMLHKKYRKNCCFTFGIYLRESNRLIGTVSIAEINYNYKIAQIGYSLNEDYWHKGYAFEAVKAFMDFLFTKVGVERIEAKVMVENTASEKLLIKLGFTKEALLKKGAVCRGDPVNVNLFSLVK